MHKTLRRCVCVLVLALAVLQPAGATKYNQSVKSHRLIHDGLASYDRGELRRAKELLESGLELADRGTWWWPARGQTQETVRGHRVLAQILWELGEDEALIRHAEANLEERQALGWTCFVLERQKRWGAASRCWSDYGDPTRAKRPIRSQAIDEVFGPVR